MKNSKKKTLLFLSQKFSISESNIKLKTKNIQNKYKKVYFLLFSLGEVFYLDFKTPSIL